MLAVLGIVGIMAALLIGQVPSWQAAAEKPHCISNMRSIYLSLATYLNDHNSWPQLPKGTTIGSRDEFDFWIKTLQPYGIDRRNWLCPTLLRTAKEKGVSDAELPEIHYVPSLFDSKPFTPHAWPTMPWLSEVGNMHGKGSMICFPDGSIRNYFDVYDSAR